MWFLFWGVYSEETLIGISMNFPQAIFLDSFSMTFFLNGVMELHAILDATSYLT